MAIKIEINPSYEWQPDIKDKDISYKELEVIVLLAQGFENEVIAEILGIQYQSVKNHLFKLIKKLGASNSAEALAIAIGNNLLTIINTEQKQPEYTKMQKFFIVLNRLLVGEDTELGKKVKKWMIRHGIDVDLGVGGSGNVKGKG